MNIPRLIFLTPVLTCHSSEAATLAGRRGKRSAAGRPQADAATALLRLYPFELDPSRVDEAMAALNLHGKVQGSWLDWGLARSWILVPTCTVAAANAAG